MLVLSRKEKQRVLFPNLDISVEILRIEGKTVRVGVEAPNEIKVLREEIMDRSSPAFHKNSERLASTRRHEFRNRLNTASLALNVLQKQLERGLVDDAEITLRNALEEFDKLNRSTRYEPPSISLTHPKSVRLALIVEDDANERELLSGYLKLNGFEVDAVDDGQAAIDYLSKRRRPDVVLMDMNMPRMNGGSAIKAIRRDPRHRGLKLFAVSGMDPKRINIPEGKAGVDRWFSKPLNPAKFVSELEEELVGCEAAR